MNIPHIKVKKRHTYKQTYKRRNEEKKDKQLSRPADKLINRQITK